MDRKFNLYFSHSWHPQDVDLNLKVWGHVEPRCNLLIDVPTPPKPGEDPPLYINRMEELLRRSDLFLAVLSYRPPQPGGEEAARRAGKLNCSPWVLFEIRLAERANRPRLVIYDVRTGFKPPRQPPPRAPRATYVQLNFDEIYGLLRSRQEPTSLTDKLKGWLDWVGETMVPRRYDFCDVSLLYLPQGIPDRDQAVEQIEAALTEANYDRPLELGESFRCDAELFHKLTCGGLLVAEVSDAQSLGVYSVAHALFVPSVRLFHRFDNDPGRLPWLLRGHPGGYQDDIVGWTSPAELGQAVAEHALAMLAATRTISEFDEGKRHLEERLYAKKKLFISHDYPLDRRDFIDLVVRKLKESSIDCWEYAIENRAGEKWRERLDAELAAATDFVVFFSTSYELSEACDWEFEWALEKRPNNIIPFLVGGRTKHNFRLKDHHQQMLRGGDDETNASAVVERVKEVLRAAS